MALLPIPPGDFPRQVTQTGGVNWNPLDWFSDAIGAAKSWFSGLGGNIASGLEGGFVALLRDIGGWLIAPVEILIGAVIMFFTIGYIFKDDLIAAVVALRKAV